MRPLRPFETPTTRLTYEEALQMRADLHAAFEAMERAFADDADEGDDDS